MEIVLIYDDLGFVDYYNIPQYVYFFHKPQKRTKEFFSPLSFDFSHKPLVFIIVSFVVVAVFASLLISFGN